MTIVGIRDIAAAYRRVGAAAGDTIVYHGSMKSMGYVEGGAAAVIDGILEAAAPGGTAAIATLWYNGDKVNRAPEMFNIDTSSAYNGAMAEAMRLDPRSVRSSNCTHSVNAAGTRKYELTADHGGGRKYPSPWNEEAFAEISPWSKFYEWNALYTFIGVDFNSCTMKHWIESRLTEHYLEMLPAEKKAKFRLQLAHDAGGGLWNFFDMRKMRSVYEKKGVIKTAPLGNAELAAIRTRPLVEIALEELEKTPEKWFKPEYTAWIDGIRKYVSIPEM